MRGRKRGTARRMKEGRVRKEAYKGDVASEVSSISKAAHSLPPPPPVCITYSGFTCLGQITGQPPIRRVL